MDSIDASTHQVFPDPIGYINEVKRLKNVVLGIRWTTHKCDDALTGIYKKSDTDKVLNWLKDAKVDQINGQEVNFFIRSHYANRSRENLMDLYKQLGKNNRVTFTIYSDEQYWFEPKPLTPLDIADVRDAIMFFGAENVHLQVSDQIRADLALYGLPDLRP